MGREYIRIMSEREHVIRNSAEGTRAKLVIDSVSYDQKRDRGEEYAWDAQGFMRIERRAGQENMFAEGSG